MIWSTRSFRRLLLVSMLLVFSIPLVTNAYTIVMRDGRRLEIPAVFTVTKTTLTYQVSGDIQVTLQLATIDIPATERTNGEPAGSLLGHATRDATPNVGRQGRVRSQRSITNQDLESFRRARVESELAYERRRKELGLPSVEVSRQLIAASAERAQEQLLSMRSSDQESENYWRSRASALRNEMTTTEARIEFIRNRLNEIPADYAFGSFPFLVPFGSFGQFPLGPSFPFNGTGSRAAGTPFGARLSFDSGLNRGPHVFPHSGAFRGPRRRLNLFPDMALVALPFQSYDYSYERTTLITQLDELLTHRAALQSQRRELEDEARRAGAYPGWLRK